MQNWLHNGENKITNIAKKGYLCNEYEEYLIVNQTTGSLNWEKVETELQGAIAPPIGR